jgi:hypothetical protein
MLAPIRIAMSLGVKNTPIITISRPGYGDAGEDETGSSQPVIRRYAGHRRFAGRCASDANFFAWCSPNPPKG